MKKNWRKILILSGGSLAALLVLFFAGLRLYAHYADFDYSYTEVTVEEYKRDKGMGMVRFNRSQQTIDIHLTEDLLNSLLGQRWPCGVIRLPQQRAYLKMEHWSGDYPVSAAVAVRVKDGTLFITLTDFRLGTGNIPIPAFILGEKKEWTVEIESLLPSWLQAQSLKLGEEEAVLQTKIQLSELSGTLEEFLQKIQENYLNTALRENQEGSDLMPAVAQAYEEKAVDADLSLDILEDFVTDQSELFSLLTLLEPEKAAEFFEQNQVWFQEKPDYALFAKIQSDYELQIKGWVADSLQQLLRQKTGTVQGQNWPLYGVQGTPYDAVSGELYDMHWIQQHHGLKSMYADYAASMQYYFDNQAGTLTVMADLNDHQMLLLQEDSYWVEDKENVSANYPGWDKEPDIPELLGAESALGQELKELLRQKYGAEAIHIRYLAASREEAFGVFSVNQEKELRSVMFQKAEAWQAASEKITNYRQYLQEHPETNGMLFPDYTIDEVLDKPLSAAGKSQLISYLRAKKSMTGRDTLLYYSYIGTYLYVQTSAKKEWVVRLNEKGAPGEVLPAEEADSVWTLPPFLMDVL